MQSRRAKEEVKAFELNAARGLRDVGMTWLLRRLFVPLLCFLLICAGAAFVQSGVWAALPVTLIAGGYAAWVTGLYRRHYLRGAPLKGRAMLDRLLGREDRV